MSLALVILVIIAANGAIKRWPQNTISTGSNNAVRSAATEYEIRSDRGRVCFIVSGGTERSGACRGRTLIDDTVLVSASALKKSLLYWAMPPRPPKASVTKASTAGKGFTPCPSQTYSRQRWRRSSSRATSGEKIPLAFVVLSVAASSRKNSEIMMSIRCHRAA